MKRSAFVEKRLHTHEDIEKARERMWLGWLRKESVHQVEGGRNRHPLPKTCQDTADVRIVATNLPSMLGPTDNKSKLLPIPPLFLFLNFAL
jgi:hypothetical protein